MQILKNTLSPANMKNISLHRVHQEGHTMLLEKLYAELRHSQFPIFIWGAGSMSIEVEKRLNENGITPAGRFINTQIAQSHIIHNTKRIFSLDELKETYFKINVVMGHGHYEKAAELKLNPLINRVYIIPNPYAQYKGPDLQYVHDNFHKIEFIKKRLTDDHSRYVLEKYIAATTTNDINHLLDSDICINDMFDLGEMNITSMENFVDIGAWEGDTLEAFMKKTNGHYDHIYAVEPDPCSFRKLSAKFDGKTDISLFQCGLGKEEGEFYLSAENSQSTYLSQTETIVREKVNVTTIDQLFEGCQISLIKIFVPFMFLDILKGGKKCISQNKPRLLINVAADDKFLLYDTVQWITDLNMDYKLALRFDFPMPTRLCLYVY